MVFAFALIQAKKYKLLDDAKSENLFSKGLSWMVGILAVLGLGVSKPQGLSWGAIIY